MYVQSVIFSYASSTKLKGMKKKDPVSMALVLQLIIIAFLTDPSSCFEQSCSNFCVCDTWYGLQRASCTGRHLYSIHTGLSNQVEALDLYNNSISLLNNHELANVGLTRIKYLNLSKNSINEIGLNAFAGLSNLAVLDLSRNHLHYILTNTFIDNQNLRVLRLSRNNFNVHVPKLHSPSLTDLNMDSCLISHVPLDTFEGLGQLRNLDLSNNMMIQLDTLVIQTLPLLRKLSLEGNPWSCNKPLVKLEEYLKMKSIHFDSLCKEHQEPKKFEKMILVKPSVKHKAYHQPTLSKNSKNTKHNASNQHDADVSMCGRVTNARKNIKGTEDETSPYVFILIGYLLGSATTIVICYMWLTKCYLSHRFCSRRDRNDPQRVSLLRDQWQNEESISTFNSDMNERITCPGTPPPPYREVILHPGIYRSSSSSST